jgi:N6-adenosine-specific RNA methylase IME4
MPSLILPGHPLFPLKSNAYGLAMIDPPWRFTTYSAKGKGKSAEQHYPTMTMDEILAMQVADLAHPAGMYVWLWATAPMYDEARACFDAWGVKYVTQGVWVKTTKAGLPHFGTGYILRNTHEPFLIGKVGKPKIHSRSIRSVIMAQRREHSRKPDEAYVAADAMAGPDALKADVFSREVRPGWDAWGNEVSKFAAANDNDSAISAAA